ncbi:hypothetical protein ACFPES_12635 [Paenibacillus sp. GCM10023248]|uniref:hypothetical protein n=1 Tax=unclassified Paenibacillus TaxID=185978 RepID=UPI00237A0275|nr:hypothetical protein [Paenibacillus sp. MAHUQ-63]MDD9267875.1 hypothetical protein [Paenibacillus sp. MAHUQ-63]
MITWSKSFITKEGILHNDNFYTCSYAIKQRWFEKEFSNESSLPTLVFELDAKIILILINGLLVEAYLIERSDMTEKQLNQYYIKINRLKNELKEQKRKNKKFTDNRSKNNPP